jgi:phosphate transport system substrate-binding protein
MSRLSFIAALLVCTFQIVSAEDIVRVGSGAAASQNIFVKIKEPMEKEIGLKLELQDNGPVDAFKAVDAGTLDCAIAGLTFPDWMALMKKEGVTVKDPDSVKSRVIGKDIIRIILHPDIKIKELSKDQLKGLMTGKTSNWKDVGGPDLAVTVVFGTEIPGTQAVFQKQVMDGENYAEKRLSVAKAPDVKAKVIATTGSIGLAPISLVDATVSVPSIPEIGRPITLVTRGEPSPLVLKMIQYIAGPGKKHIAK